MDLTRLSRKWLDEVAVLRRRGAEAQAVAIESCISDLEQFAEEWRLQSLTVKEAAAESGYTSDHLSRLLTEELIENAGVKGRPRIRRCDLPSKPGFKSDHT